MAKPDMVLWLSDSRGVYIPRDFAKSFADRDKNVSGVSDEDWLVLEAGPEHEQYWDTWTKAEQNAIITDEEGVKYSLWQSGDLWLVPVGMEWDEYLDTYKWPEKDS